MCMPVNQTKRSRYNKKVKFGLPFIIIITIHYVVKDPILNILQQMYEK